MIKKLGGSMFNCLFWMFKQEDFKKHFVYLLSTYIFFLASALLLFFVASNFVSALAWQISLYRNMKAIGLPVDLNRLC